jgi:excisionase family DNA binding protein
MATDPQAAVRCEFYTPKEVAQVLNLSTDLVYDLLRDGKLPAVKLGTGKRMVWRIPIDGLQSMLDSQLQSSTGN